MDPATAAIVVGATQAASNVGTNIANYQLYKKQRADNRQMPQLPIIAQLICGI